MKDNDTFGWLSTSHRKKLVLMIAAILMVCILECVRLGVIMTVKSEYYMQKADELHQRERRIKAKRGRILDRNGEKLAEKYGVKHLPSDFKKKGGYLRSIALSEEYHLYRQDYCGCVFSKRDSEVPKQTNSVIKIAPTPTRMLNNI